MADGIYIDNVHDQLYAVAESDFTGLSAGATGHDVTMGLSDWAELPGQSTWYIRKIVFHARMYTDLIPAPDTQVYLCGGIVNRDIAGSASYDKPGDFQDVAGWFLSGVWHHGLIEATAQHNNLSWTKTYRPSKALELNREQDIIFTVKNRLGNDVDGLLDLYVHAERGK